MTDAKEQKVHPSFSDPQDVTLISSDGTQFHIASAQLARASGWFRTMFTLPQSDVSDGQQAKNQAHITVSEDALTLEVLLNISCGTGLSLGLSRLSNLKDLELCLRAAEKYEITAATEVLPLLLYSSAIQKDALHLYALAGRYGPKDVAATALKRLVTTRLDFQKLAHIDHLQLGLLVAERQARIEKFCSLLAQSDATAPFFRENVDNCTTRGAVQAHYSQSSQPRTWSNLLFALQTAFIKHPSVESLDSDEKVKVQIAGLTKVTCTFCGQQQYVWNDIRRRLFEAMDGK